MCVSAGGDQGAEARRRDGILRVHGPGQEQKCPLGPISGPRGCYWTWNWAQRTEPDLPPPAGTETLTASLWALGISLGALQFGDFYLCFFSNHYCPICYLIYFRRMCVASAVTSG